MTKNLSPLIASDDFSTIIEQPLDELVRSIVSGAKAPRPQSEVITQWHKIVVDHAALANATLVLRKTSRDGEASEIRGRIYIDPITKQSIVRSDNSPPIWVYNRAFYSDRNPPLQFVSLLDEKAFAMADRFSEAEKALLKEGRLNWPMYLQQDRKSYGLLWDLNWKLCHLLPCSPNAGKPKDLFLQKLYDSDRRGALVNAFVRNLSAFNFIPGPSPKHYSTSLDGKPIHDIGEDPLFLDWAIHLLAMEIYSSSASAVFTDFLRAFGGREIRKPQSNPKIRIQRKHPTEKPEIGPKSMVIAEVLLSSQQKSETIDATDSNEGDLVLLVRPPGQEEKYENIWDGSRLSILATHTVIVNQIKKAQESGHPRIFVQIAPRGAGKRYLIGSALVASIESSGTDFLVHFAEWIASENSIPFGRAYGSAYYWVKKSGATGAA